MNSPRIWFYIMSALAIWNWVTFFRQGDGLSLVLAVIMTVFAYQDFKRAGGG